MTELVISQNGNLVTTSVIVAEKFGKRHGDVLRAIDDILAKRPLRNFAEGSYQMQITGSQSHRMFYLDETAFSILVMGFTGEAAFDWKLKFIEAFQKMRDALAPKTPAELHLQQAQLLLENERRAAAAQAKADEALSAVKALEARVNDLPASLETPESRQFWTILQFCEAFGPSDVSLEVRQLLGRKARAICAEDGLEYRKIPDERYSYVNAYPKDVLHEVFSEFFDARYQ